MRTAKSPRTAPPGCSSHAVAAPAHFGTAAAAPAFRPEHVPARPQVGSPYPTPREQGCTRTRRVIHKQPLESRRAFARSDATRRNHASSAMRLSASRERSPKFPSLPSPIRRQHPRLDRRRRLRKGRQPTWRRSLSIRSARRKKFGHERRGWARAAADRCPPSPPDTTRARQLRRHRARGRSDEIASGSASRAVHEDSSWMFVDSPARKKDHLRRYRGQMLPRKLPPAREVRACCKYSSAGCRPAQTPPSAASRMCAAWGHARELERKVAFTVALISLGPPS